MPKKSGRNNLRESGIGKIPSSEVIVKQFRSIHVNVKNAKRWFVLKKRLALVTDDELVAYLLDLAEPIIRYEDDRIIVIMTAWPNCQRFSRARWGKSINPQPAKIRSILAIFLYTSKISFFSTIFLQYSSCLKTPYF